MRLIIIKVFENGGRNAHLVSGGLGLTRGNDGDGGLLALLVALEAAPTEEQDQHQY